MNTKDQQTTVEVTDVDDDALGHGGGGSNSTDVLSNPSASEDIGGYFVQRLVFI